MQVVTRHGVIGVSTHAVQRYQTCVERVEPSRVRTVIGDALDAAELAHQVPGWAAPHAHLRHSRDEGLWLVTSDWACPLLKPGDHSEIDYMVPTVLKRQRRAKADVRAWREQRDDEGMAA